MNRHEQQDQQYDQQKLHPSSKTKKATALWMFIIAFLTAIVGALLIPTPGAPMLIGAFLLVVAFFTQIGGLILLALIKEVQ